jgi:hypothetical protein
MVSVTGKEHKKDLTFKVFTAMRVQIVVFWVVSPCSLIHSCQLLEDYDASICRVGSGRSMLQQDFMVAQFRILKFEQKNLTLSTMHCDCSQ